MVSRQDGCRWAIALLFCLLLVGCASDPPSEDPESCLVDAPNVAEACTGVAAETYYCSAFAGEGVSDPKDIGAMQPRWVLQDRQSLSCGAEQFYGLEAFRGKPLVVVLLWAGCGFCQAQTEKIQQMQYELEASGVEVNFVIVNRAAPNPLIEELTNRCNFPVFQDIDDVDV